MKLISHFNTFLNDTVNLNPSRISLLEDRISTIRDVLSDSDYRPRIRRFSAQGSWAHKTIIKPPKDKDFDADLVVLIDEVEDWEPADYVDELYKTFKDHKTYADIASRGTRCVQLDYKGDFHLDVVPCIQTIQGERRSYRICNRRENTFEATAPEAYTAWLADRNRLTGNNMLRKVVRLVKYQRDVKTTFSVKSILLTTLLGEQIRSFDEYYRDDFFPDVPTALKSIADRLDDFLQANPSMPIVRNPVLSEEDFNRHWAQDTYESFRERIHEYKGWIDDAYTDPNRDESISKWRRVFGDDFAKGEVSEKASSVAEGVLDKGATSRDLVRAIKERGVRILEFIPNSFPHIKRAPWPPQKHQLPVVVSAAEYTKDKEYIVGNDITKKPRDPFRGTPEYPSSPA